ncbi:hypothetical protein K501DRAFT_323826 [Backusella circina FSU 941]|nr:hypothetical protein K501DRAFT_323826 [Backusella circina FSU 941]
MTKEDNCGDKTVPTKEIDDIKSTDQKKPFEKKKGVPIYKLFRFSSTYDKVLILLAIIFSAGTGVLTPFAVIFMGDFLNELSNTLTLGDTSKLLEATLPIIKTFAYLGAVLTVSAYISNCFWVLTGENQTQQIKKAYLNSIMNQDMAWFDKAEDGSLTTRLASDTQIIQDGISEKFGFMVNGIFQFLSGFIVAFVKGWNLAIVLLASVPVMMIAGVIMGHFTTKYTLESQNNYAEAGSISEQVFSGIRTVYSFSLQERFSEIYEHKLDKAFRAGVKRGNALGCGFGIFLFSVFAAYGLAFWYAPRLMIEGKLEGGTILVVFYSMMLGAQSLLELPPNLKAISSASGAAYKIFETIDRVPEINKQAPGFIPHELKGCIQFDNVKFNYPTRPDIPILKGLNLKIVPGQTVAFVGSSGSGKSTLIQLLQRLYDPIDGQVLLDGHDLKKLDVSWLRSQMGVVSQEPVLFNMSIRQNLLLGVPEGVTVTEEDLKRACTEANCHSFISKLPDRYDTMRIAIARAILKNPSILLLDEATSALDTQSERLVQRALDAASVNRTTIVIAHRLSTIHNADLIAVMNQGEIIEQGTHQELLQLNGMYANLVKIQEVLLSQKIDNGDDITVDEDEIFVAELKANGHLEPYEEISNTLFDRKNGDMFEKKDGAVIKIEEAGMDAFKLKLKKLKEKKENAKSQKSPVKRVFYQMRPEWSYISIGVLGGIIGGSLNTVFGLLLGKVVTIVIVPGYDLNPGPFQGVNLYAFSFFIIGVVCFFAYSSQIICFEVAGEKYSRRLRAILFRKYMEQEVGFYDQDDNSTGALTTKLAIDAKNVNEMITIVAGDIIQVVIITIVGLIIAFVYSWAISLVVLCIVPFIIGATYYEMHIHNDFEDSTKKASAQCGDIAGEAIKEIRTATALNCQSFFEDNYAKANERPHRLARKKAILSSIGFALLKGYTMYISAIVFYAGIRFIIMGIVDFQGMYVSMTVLTISSEQLGRCSAFIRTFTKAKIAAISIFEVVDREPNINLRMEGKEPPVNSLHGDIEYKDIEFSYPARPDNKVFSGQFNIQGKAGMTIALVGPSGCGKSTAIGMLQRWYDPFQGEISLDNNTINSFTLRNLRAHMAVVGQEPILFDMSIRENVEFGIDKETHGSDITLEQIEKACKSANIHDFIISLPDGYDTRVGDKGSQLSGGQKQRIAIARALIRNPTVLLLDEATSALDSDSEKVVQAALDSIIEKNNRTTITIAHRLSTIQNADLIYVIKDGAVAEQGTHWELLELNGIYRGLVIEQSLTV